MKDFWSVMLTPGTFTTIATIILMAVLIAVHRDKNVQVNTVFFTAILMLAGVGAIATAMMGGLLPNVMLG